MKIDRHSRVRLNEKLGCKVRHICGSEAIVNGLHCLSCQNVLGTYQRHSELNNVHTYTEMMERYHTISLC